MLSAIILPQGPRFKMAEAGFKAIDVERRALNWKFLTLAPFILF
jgi:hypothetical protein